MKTKIKYICLVVATCAVMSSCLKNKDITFPDYSGGTSVYFATQALVRTITLGKEEFLDNSLDNEHKVEIKATLGGTQDNKADISIGYVVDESLLNNLYFPDGTTKMLALPPTYYTFLSDKMVIPKGSILNGVKVQFTDAFFADPDAIKNTYVIPLKMTAVQNADSILSGKNYVLYAVKFVNKWHGNYWRRGKDNVTYQGDATATPVARHTQYISTDEVNKLSTSSYMGVDFPVVFKDKSGANVSITLRLTFDASGNCTVSSASAGVTASGTGSFVENGETVDGEKQDVLHLNYQVSVPDKLSASTMDTLVIRDRAVGPEYITPVIK